MPTNRPLDNPRRDAMRAYAEYATLVVYLHADLGMSFREICAYLNEHDNGGGPAGGGTWHATTLKRIYDRAKPHADKLATLYGGTT